MKDVSKAEPVDRDKPTPTPAPAKQPDKPEVFRVAKCMYCGAELRTGSKYELCRKHFEMFDFFRFLMSPVGKTESGLVLPSGHKPDGKFVTRFEQIMAEARAKGKG